MIKPLSVSPDAGSEVRFQAYINALSEEIGHADRIDPLRSYCTGLLLPGERKSIEPMAARLDPRHVQATHQSLHHFVAKAPWDDAAVLTAVREQVLPALTRHGPITAWILDDTGFPKKGTHSVGVARQYCKTPLKELTRSRKFQQPALANLWKSIGKSFLRKRM